MDSRHQDILNNIAAFILAKHSEKGNFAILRLNQKEWTTIAKERVRMDELAIKTEKQIKDIIKNGVQPEPDTANKMKENMNREKEILTEYNKPQAIREQLDSTSIFFNLQNMRVTKVFMDYQPHHYKIYLRNKNYDFLILLNTYLLSTLPIEETYISVVHEALHFVDYIKGSHSTYSEIENKSKMLAREYLATY